MRRADARDQYSERSRGGFSGEFARRGTYTEKLPSDFLRRAAPFVALAALVFFYLFHLSGVGILSTDEPRYAAIGRAMADSGDWITPRLWGETWFEKSPLLYWMTGVATKIGAPGEAAARGPVALVSVAFIAFLWIWVRRQFGEPEAWISSLILATSAGWASYSFVAVTDVPMSAALGVAVLLALQPEQTRATAWWTGVWLGVALLAKGLVPLVLFIPVAWFVRQRLVPIALACILVAAPWYIACYAANGQIFLSDFIWKHHVQRFFSESLQHVQSFWFYIPVFLAGFFPWSPAVLLLRRSLLDDERLRRIVIWVTFGLLFFSFAKNKLPGYILPLMPGIAVGLGVAMMRARNVAIILGCCAALLLLLPVIGLTLPDALRSGLSRTRPDWSSVSGMPLLVVLVVVLGTFWLAASGRKTWATAFLALSAALGMTRLKLEMFPVLDEKVSVRREFQRLTVPVEKVCVDEIHRARLYGFSYYFNSAIPECSEQSRPVVLTNDPVR